MTLLSRARVLKNREKGVCVYLLEPLTALCSKCSFLSFFPSRALSTPVSCSPAFDYRWKRSAEHFSLQRDPVHVFVFPFRQCFIFLFLTKESDVEMRKHGKTQNRGCLADLPLNITGAPTDACDMKWKMKSDSCLSFQTAELTDDLPVWLASMLNSSFQLHSATCIQWWESYRNWTGRAVSGVSLKLTGAQSTCNFCSTDQFFL